MARTRVGVDFDVDEAKGLDSPTTNSHGRTDILATAAGHAESSDHVVSHRVSSAAPQLRLVKLVSDVLPQRQTVAIFDAESECVSIGRDHVFTPRIRLPAMDVSKHHANIFVIQSRGDGHAKFAISDLGSMHGTFVLGWSKDKKEPIAIDDSNALPSLAAYTRLSPPKEASQPHPLAHLDLVRVGHTVFQIHHHGAGSSWMTSCHLCALKEDGSNEIPFLARNEVGAMKSINADTTTSSTIHSADDIKAHREKARRQAMRQLRTQRIAQTEPESSTALRRKYADRAAERRKRNGAHAGITAEKEVSWQPTSPMPVHAARLVSEVQDGPLGGAHHQPPQLDDASNRGFKLYSAMLGPASGAKNAYRSEATAHGTEQVASLLPIARGVEGRAGLGSKPLTSVEELVLRQGRSDSSPNSRNRPGDVETPHARVRRRYEEAAHRNTSS